MRNLVSKLMLNQKPIKVGKVSLEEIEYKLHFLKGSFRQYLVDGVLYIEPNEDNWIWVVKNQSYLTDIATSIAAIKDLTHRSEDFVNLVSRYQTRYHLESHVQYCVEVNYKFTDGDSRKVEDTVIQLFKEVFGVRLSKEDDDITVERGVWYVDSTSTMREKSHVRFTCPYTLKYLYDTYGQEILHERIQEFFKKNTTFSARLGTIRIDTDCVNLGIGERATLTKNRMTLSNKKYDYGYDYEKEELVRL